MDAAAVVGEILRWLVPALVVFGVAALAGIAIAVAVRASRRSPRAKAAADAARVAAGQSLVRLDGEVEELDLEVGLSGALYGGGAPASLRRARMTAQTVRDASFADYAALDDAGSLIPAEAQRRAQRITARIDEALGVIARARADNEQWMRENTSAAAQVDAARGRLDHVRQEMGDPTALLDELRARFDEGEYTDASAAASAAEAQVDEAQVLLDRAAESAHDPSRSALSDLTLAERRVRSAQSQMRRLETVHRLVTQAAAALPDEIEAARGAIRQALVTRESLEPDASQRLGAAIDEAEAALARARRDGQRRPRATVDAIARLRDRLDLALGDARTAQQRLRGARTALPGTMAAAQNAVAQAESAVATAGVDARVRLASAQQELATARQLGDPVEALDAARRAMRRAEDAQALASYDRMSTRR